MTLEQLSKISMKFTTASQTLLEVSKELGIGDTKRKILASYLDEIKEKILQKIGEAYTERKQDV